MATIFRGPTYAQQQKKPAQPTVWTGASVLLTTLALSTAVPFQTADVFVTPQHPSHRISANFDTSCETPKTLYADAAQAFCVAPHFAPLHPRQRGQLNFDTSEGTAKVLYADAVKPNFNPPHLAPNAQSKRGQLNADTTADTPLACLVGPPTKPFFNPTHSPSPRIPWLPADTSMETGKPLYADATAPTFNPTQSAPDRPRFLGFDTTVDTPNTLLAILATPPFVNSQPAPIHRQRIMAADTTQDTPLTLLAPAPGLANTLARATFSNQQKTKGNLGGETSRGIAPVAVSPGAPPFSNAPTLLSVQVQRTLPDTSKGSYALDDTQVASAQLEFLPAPPVPRLGADTSQSTPAALYPVSVPPLLNTLARTTFVNAQKTKGNLGSETSRGIAPTPPVVAAPFVNLPGSGVDRPRQSGDTSRGAAPDTLLAPFVNPPAQAISSPRNVADTSADTPKTLFADSVVPFFNSPQIQVDRQRPVTDSSQKSPQALFAAVLAPFSNPPSLLAPRFFFQPFDASEGTPKTLYGDSVAPSFNPPALQVDRIRPVTDTSSALSKALYADSVAPGFNPPTLLVERPRAVADTSSESFRALFTALPPVPVFNAPAFQIAPVRVFSETSQSTSQALLSVSGVPFAQRDWTVAAEYRLQYVAKWDQPQFTPDAYPPPIPEVETPVIHPGGSVRISVPRSGRRLKDDEEWVLILSAMLPLLK